MIYGAHFLFYSKDAEADRRCLGDVCCATCLGMRALEIS